MTDSFATNLWDAARAERRRLNTALSGSRDGTFKEYLCAQEETPMTIGRKYCTPDIVFVLRLPHHEASDAPHAASTFPAWGPRCAAPQGTTSTEYIRRLLNESVYHAWAEGDHLEDSTNDSIDELLNKGYDVCNVHDASEFSLELLMAIYQESHFEHEVFKMYNDLVVFAVRWRNEFLLTYAEKVYYPVHVAPEMLGVLNIKLNSVRSTGKLPFRSTYAEFVKRTESDDGDTLEIFTSRDRSRMMWHFTLEHLNFAAWLRNGHICDSFTPHCVWRLSQLRRENKLKLRLGRMQTQHYREYFGSSVGFYMAFLDYTYKWSIGLFAVALVHAVAMSLEFGWSSFWFHHGYTTQKAIYGMVLCFSSIIFVEFWERQENWLSVVWGIDEGHHVKVMCPEFEGVPQAATFDENFQITVPHPLRRRLGICCAACFELLYICLIIGVLGPQYMLQIEHPQLVREVGKWLNLAITLQCQVFKFIWKNIVEALVRLEQHKYQDDADQAIDRKVTNVYFVCLFTPVVYETLIISMMGNFCPEVDGVKQPRESCITHTEYEESVVFVFFSQFLSEVSLIVRDFAVPLIYEMKGLVRVHAHVANAYDSQHLLLEYDGFYLSQDYLELLFPMAFVFLFGSICPLITVLTWLLLAGSQRIVDRWKLLHLHRRPMPVECKGIGSERLRFMRIVAYCASAANWGLIVAMCPYFRRTFPSRSHKIIVFGGGWFLIARAKDLLSFLTPSTSKMTDLLIQQGNWQRDKLYSYDSQRRLGAQPRRLRTGATYHCLPRTPRSPSPEPRSPEPRPQACCGMPGIMPFVRRRQLPRLGVDDSGKVGKNLPSVETPASDSIDVADSKSRSARVSTTSNDRSLRVLISSQGGFVRGSSEVSIPELLPDSKFWAPKL